MRARVHEREAGRNRRRESRPPATRINARGLADELTKRGAERAEASEADGEADLGNGKRRVPQELLGALDAAPQEVSVRRLAERFLGAADAVRPRRVRLAGEGRHVERFREVAIDQILRTAKMNVNRDRVAHSPERLEQLPSVNALSSKRATTQTQRRPASDLSHLPLLRLDQHRATHMKGRRP